MAKIKYKKIAAAELIFRGYTLNRDYMCQYNTDFLNLWASTQAVCDGCIQEVRLKLIALSVNLDNRQEHNEHIFTFFCLSKYSRCACILNPTTFVMEHFVKNF